MVDVTVIQQKIYPVHVPCYKSLKSRANRGEAACQKVCTLDASVTDDTALCNYNCIHFMVMWYQRNDYIPLAQESSAMLPDRFTIGYI